METSPYFELLNTTNGQLCIFRDNIKPLNGFSRGELERSAVVKGLKFMLNSENVEVSHDDSGAPYLVSHSDLEVSISHSKGWFALQCSKQCPVGVDIQVFHSEGLKKGRSYFVNDSEEEKWELTDLELHLIWSVKEACYKRMKGGVVEYKSSMTVIEIGEEVMKVSLEENIYHFAYRVHKDYVLVYSLN